MQQVFDGQTGQKGMAAAVGLEGDVVEPTHLDPIAVVLPANVGIDDRGPGNCQRVHVVAVLQHMGGIARVLAPAAGADDFRVTAAAAFIAADGTVNLFVKNRHAE